MKKSGQLPGLRYQFRDLPHTTCTVAKGAIKHLKDPDDLLEALITGKDSFAHRARYSNRFRQIWRASQGQEDDYFKVLENLSYGMSRFHSRSKPLSRFFLKLGSAVRVLLQMSRDQTPAHRSDQRWATELLRKLLGPEGYRRLVILAVQCDYFVVAVSLVRVQEKSDKDISLTAADTLQVLEVCEAMFLEGRIFRKEPNGSYTWHLLQGMRRSADLWFGKGSREHGRMEWPVSRTLLEKPVFYARNLYDMTLQFFNLNFPDHSWRIKFSAFHHGENKLPEQVRLNYIEDIAKKEGVNPAQAREQLSHVLQICIFLLSSTSVTGFINVPFKQRLSMTFH